MKRDLWLLSFLIFSLAAANAQAQNHKSVADGFSISIDHSQSSLFESAIRKVRLLESVSYRVGWTLEPGEFYKLFQECLKFGTVDEFKTLLRDENPIVRVMGLFCLAKSLNAEEFDAIAKPLFKDGARVKYTNGCLLNQTAAVGSLARRLQENRFFLNNQWC